MESNSIDGNNESTQPPSITPIPIPPPPASCTHNAIRATYMNLFNQILDSSFNINCICKTTIKSSSSDCKNSNSNEKTLGYSSNLKNCNIFDTVNDFMSDDDEEYDKNENDIEMDGNNAINNENNRDRYLFDLDYYEQILYSNAPDQNVSINSMKLNKSCDLTCFENMRYIHSTLKNCFQNDELTVNDHILKFESIWSNLKFLSKNPKSCDYYGSTLYHYAAADNNLELLKCLIAKDPSGIFAIDSKGMTPLMRAVQRNNMKCVEYLLSETKSDLNGSSYSAYTPLWFAVSNGYNDLVKLILNYNASASIIDKSVKKTNLNLNNQDLEILIQDDDHIGIRGACNSMLDTNNASQQQTSYLFSPLRASIVYSRFQIMIYLLEYGANVYELFGVNFEENNLVVHSRQNFTKTNEDFVNALKLLHRQFGPFITQNKNNSLLFNEYDKCLNKLNEFIESPNVYRRMLIEFVKSIYTKLNHNLNFSSRIDLFLSSTNKNTLSHVKNLTQIFENNFSSKIDDIDWNDYLNIVNDFFVTIDFLLSNEQNPENNTDNDINNLSMNLNQLSRKPNFHQNLFDFSKFLMLKFFIPKSLKELCRFKLRRYVFEKISSDNMQYSKTFSKKDHQLDILKSFNIPSYLINYLLHEN